MSLRDLLRYGLCYALIYVGVLALIFAGGVIVAMFYEFRPADMSIGALIAAALVTYGRFLKNRMRLPTRGEYRALVAVSTAIVVTVDATLAALVIHSTRDYGLDGLVIPFLVGLPFLKGLIGNALLYAHWNGERTLKAIRARSVRPDATGVEPGNKMMLGDTGPFLLSYFAAYIPLYGLLAYLSATGGIRGMEWLWLVAPVVSAVCALTYTTRRLGRRPAGSEYWLLVVLSTVCATAFEVSAKAAVDTYRLSGLPNFGTWPSYAMGGLALYLAIHALAYSRPMGWLVQPRIRPVEGM